MKKNKKHQNKKKTEAINRLLESNKLLSDIGLQCDDDLASIGIVLEHIGISQLAIGVLRNIDNFVSKYVGLDVSIFVQNLVAPITKVSCPVFPIRDLQGWENPLITTNLSTTLDAIGAGCKSIYHYVFDLDFIDNYVVSGDDIRKCFVDKNIHGIFTRHDTYKKIIENEFGVHVLDQIVTDFDIVSVSKMIFGRKK